LKKMLTLTALLCLSAEGGMVTARWGVKGSLQHPGTLKYESLGKEGTLLTFDLSALPANTTVCGARLLFSGVNWKENGFDIVPATRADGKLAASGKPLLPVAAWNQWLDATEAIRAASRVPSTSLGPGPRAQALLWMRNSRAFRQDATVLEIAYEGEPPGQLPEQVTGVKAISRSGQVFITFKEVAPLDEGKEGANWGELVRKFKGDYYGPLPGGEPDELSYRVYSHDKAITVANVGQAQLLGEVLPGSAFNTRFALRIDEKRKREDMVAIEAGRSGEALATGPSVLVLRVAVEPGIPVPLGTGIFIDVRSAGFSPSAGGPRPEGRTPNGAFYAILTSLNGVTNAKDISAANTAGPVQVLPGDPEPVLYREIITPVSKAKYVTQWYSYWTAQPLSPWPARYDVVVQFCPDLLEKPAALVVSRGGWNNWPTPASPHATNGLHMSHTGDMPADFRTGLHDSIGTIKGFDQGKWQPFHTRRQAALLKWMAARWPIDPNRISVEMGAWGMMEIKEGNLYAMIRGWGEPELTKGFQCWDRARGIWGVPELYRGRPGDENPYVAANLTDWVLANPDKELPFFYIHAGGGAHYTEEGWPPFPRFCWAMMKAKQPFFFCTARESAVAEAIRTGKLVIRRDQSLPAFANCSLDDNLGEGDLHSGNGWNESQVNGWLLWDPATIVDEPARWEITLWIGEKCPLSEGTVDLTPRRCQKFAPKPRQRFDWANSTDDGAIQKGSAEADDRGFVTIEKLRITKGRHRIAIAAAK